MSRNNGVGSSTGAGSSQDNIHLNGNGNGGGSQQQQQKVKKKQQSVGERRELRKQYRTLIQNVTGNKSELISPSSDGLLKSLQKADTLYGNVEQAREAVLDSELLALTSQFGLEQAQKFKVSLNAYDSIGLVNRFKERLIHFTKVAVKEEEDEEEDEDDEDQDITITKGGWEKLANIYSTHFHTTPDFQFMYGPVNLQIEENKKTKTPRKATQKDAPVGAAKVAEKITDIGAQAESETTSSRVQAMKRYIEGHKGKSFVDLVADSSSFAQTVENIFYFSFLLKDGHVKLSKDDPDMTIQPTLPPEEKDYQNKSAQLTHSVVRLDYSTWNELNKVSDHSFKMEKELKDFKEFNKRKGASKKVVK